MSRFRILVLVVFVLLAVSLFLFFRQYFSLNGLIEREELLRTSVIQYPLLSLLLAFLAYIAMSMIPGTAGKSVVFAWLFGFLPGLVVVNGGLTVAAIFSFLLSRYVFQRMLHERFGWVMRRIDKPMHGGDGLFLLSLRLAHAPYTITNYAAGASDVSLRRFWWTTQLGMLPGNIALSYAGASLPSLRELAKQGLWGIIDLQLLGGLTAITLLPVAIRWLLRLLSRRP